MEKKKNKIQLIFPSIEYTSIFLCTYIQPFAFQIITMDNNLLLILSENKVYIS